VGWDSIHFYGGRCQAHTSPSSERLEIERPVDVATALIEADGVDSAERDRILSDDDPESAADPFLFSRREPPFYLDFTSHGFIRFTEGT
jgi:hypothetical protein